MINRVRSRLSYANVVATAALVVAVAGSSIAIAGGGRDVTSSGRIKAGHVTAKDLADTRIVVDSGEAGANPICSGSERLIGGGAALSGGTTPGFIGTSKPDGNGWSAGGSAGAGGRIKGYAICLSSKPRKAIPDPQGL